jgi:hypothetical protein
MDVLLRPAPNELTATLRAARRGERWVVLDSDIEVAGPFDTEEAARAWIAGYGSGAADHY